MSSAPKQGRNSGVDEMRLLQFAHITKTAGTSIEVLAKSNGVLWGCENRALWSRLSQGSRHPNRTGDPWHLPVSFVEEQMLNELLESTDLFCVVRNPYERVVSEYYCHWGSQYVVDLSKINSDDIDSFNDNLLASLCRLKALRVAGSAQCLGHWQEQNLYFMKNGTYLMPKENVIRYEQIDVDLSGVLSRYGYSFGPMGQRVRVRSYPKKFSGNDLRQDVIAMVNELYQKDFVELGYGMLSG